MNIEAIFAQKFGTEPQACVFVPGRVNLIGEHIDYNGGRVLPHALHRGVTLALSLRSDDVVRVASDRFEGVSEARTADEPTDSWAKYAHYTMRLAKDIGWISSGADIGIISNLSDGAGLSSSAALCVAVLKALREVTGRSESDVEIAQFARRVENDYIGMPCGIMDQMAVAVAKPGEALFLDTGSLDYDSIPLPEDVSFMVIHSGVHRELADGRYKQRADECLEAKSYFGTDDLCHLTLDQVEGAVDLAENVKRRVRHCITEHERTVQAASHLRARDFVRFGESMNARHVSMRDDFEMSVPAIDRLVESAVEAGAHGARLTGGGFGGCIVAAVPVDASEVWLGKVLAQHPDAFLVE